MVVPGGVLLVLFFFSRKQFQTKQNTIKTKNKKNQTTKKRCLLKTASRPWKQTSGDRAGVSVRASFRWQGFCGCVSLLRGTKSGPLPVTEGHCDPPELGREKRPLSLFLINMLELRPWKAGRTLPWGRNSILNCAPLFSIVWIPTRHRRGVTEKEAIFLPGCQPA